MLTNRFDPDADGPIELMLAVIMMGLFVGFLLMIEACSSPKASAEETKDLDCEVVAINGARGNRCENTEAVCYLLHGSLSCIKK